MNIFNCYEDFYGKVDLTDLYRQGSQLLKLAQSIRNDLGKQGYLLDQYLSTILQGLDDGAMLDASGRFVILCSELSHLIFGILDGTDKHKEHVFYPKAKAYIDTHPLPYQENYTQYSIYMLALADDFLECAATQFAKILKDHRQDAFDISVLENQFRQITDILGDEARMEQLNLLVQQRFQVVTPMSAFVQFFNDRLLYTLLHRDPETGKQIFRLWLNQDI